MPKRKPGFEAQLKELEQIVASLERGDLSLEESLALFAKGVELARACEQALQAAEQKVQILLADDHDTQQLRPFQADDER
ncbi:exodeoxyribonuclease VII small subunit [Methylothermus subterraneus]